MGFVAFNDSFKFQRSFYSFVKKESAIDSSLPNWVSSILMFSIDLLIGNTFSSSSRIIVFSQFVIERMNLSLNRGTTFLWASVLNQEWQSMVRV